MACGIRRVICGESQTTSPDRHRVGLRRGPRLNEVLLDTDTCIHALEQNPTVLKHLLAQSREDIAVSVITEAELRTGAAKSTSGRGLCSWSKIFFAHLASQNSHRTTLFPSSSAREARAGRHNNCSVGHADCSAGNSSQTRPCFK